MDGGNERNGEMSGLFKSEPDQRTQWSENTCSQTDTSSHTQGVGNCVSAYRQMRVNPWPLKWRWSNWGTAMGNELLTSECQAQQEELRSVINQSEMIDKTVRELTAVMLVSHFISSERGMKRKREKEGGKRGSFPKPSDQNQVTFDTKAAPKGRLNDYFSWLK